MRTLTWATYPRSVWRGICPQGPRWRPSHGRCGRGGRRCWRVRRRSRPRRRQCCRRSRWRASGHPGSTPGQARRRHAAAACARTYHNNNNITHVLLSRSGMYYLTKVLRIRIRIRMKRALLDPNQDAVATDNKKIIKIYLNSFVLIYCTIQ